MIAISSRRLFTIAVATALGCGDSLHPGPGPTASPPDGGTNSPPDGGTITEPAIDFFSSFEAQDPRPAWNDTVELDAHGTKRSAGVTGTPNIYVLGSVMDNVVMVKANGENPPNE